MAANGPECREKGILRVALPSGNLEQGTFKLFLDAGLELHRKSTRDYKPWMDDESKQVKLFRSMEVPSAVASGSYDIGITGWDRIEDWMLEFDVDDLSETDVVELKNLEYGKVRMVLACPQSFSDIDSPEALRRGFPKNLRIATEFAFKGRKYLLERTGVEPNMFLPGKEVKIGSPISLIYSWGATEAKPPQDAEAVIENIETRHTLDDNYLKEIDTVGEGYSTATLIANRHSLDDSACAGKIGYIERALMSVVKAREFYHVFMNVPRGKLGEVLSMLPALKRPTVSGSEGDEWVRVDTIIHKKDYNTISEDLLGLGVEDIIPTEVPRITNTLPPYKNYPRVFSKNF